MSKRKQLIKGTVIGGLASLYLLAAAPMVRTYPPFLKKAQAMNLPAKDCTFCHINAGGGEPYNERGTWLIEEKKKRNADSVDVAWMKEYKEPTTETGKSETKASTSGINFSDVSVDASSVGQSASRKEPTRTLMGRMVANNITVHTSDGKPTFNYLLTKASVVGGKLQLHGQLIAPGKSVPIENVVATFAGSMARSTNPWPKAKREFTVKKSVKNNEQIPQGGQTKNPEATGQLGQLAQGSQSTARATPIPTAPEGKKAGGEVNEQNQSLYAAKVSVGSGCEVIFFKMVLPKEVSIKTNEPVQLGVSLAQLDNKAGEQLNNQICQVMRSLKSKTEVKELDKQVADLNEMLAKSK